MVRIYSKARDGEVKLAPHFAVREFACPATDEVLVDEWLPAALELMRGYIGDKPLRVTSGYRSPAYNAAVKGAAQNSQHILGTAADVTSAGVPPLTLCRAAEAALERLDIPGGIGLYDSFCHVDMRERRARWETTARTGGAERACSGWSASALPDTEYTVRPGDTLSAIGKRFGIAYMDLARYNGIADPNKIRAGQKLAVPAPKAV
ncbi:MAG: LysM peptidoglycan-binding domain-containing protein [Oscillospiraceae bacterium]|jgi:nucleoid-associated protein YgaU|nr:LysM peptidoglycan-binding domain-containing protein [Oscillospiraceae bacterium]